MKLCIRYTEYLYDLFEDKRWWKLSGHIFLVFLGLLSLGAFLGGVFSIFLKYWEQIISVIGGICFIIMAIIGFSSTKKENSALPEPIQASYDPVFLNSTYSLLRTNLVSVLAETADMLCLRVPSTPSQIEAPVHHDIVSNAAIFHFLCGKQEPSVKTDPFEAMGIIQSVLERRLNNHDLMGITQTTTFYNGMAYPAIMVDGVQDLGRYIQIDVAITNESYLRYRTNRLYSNLNDGISSNPYDRTF
ncbi:hypothetical protein [Enterocloster alcoholdehydrogenati]|uniref:hypothetical protein n=1 Tax=Enterocloster alcoholdehydrogenati TaxID=2547410 RepID=UPI001593818C|nr:hypothetical protein [Enterocloster alcoholdehydrogenati]